MIHCIYVMMYIGVDALLSVIAHELAESVTNPELNAWYDADHEENAGVIVLYIYVIIIMYLYYNR